MSLGSEQREFTLLVATLIAWAYENGYELTLGDAYRDPRLHGEVGEKKGYGHPSSFHKVRKAIDLNLFKDGVYLTTTEAHSPLGELWESLDPRCTWGGRFNDGNHYSFGEAR
jgi:hypothetical protein